MIRMLGLALCVGGFSVWAAEPPLLDAGAPQSRTRLVESFSPFENPGKGTITFKHAGKTEVVELGETGGYYATGIIFHASQLPEPIRSDLQGHHIIQISMGSLPSKTQERFPQFGMMSLVSKRVPDQRRTYRTTLPTDSSKRTSEHARVLFTSPSTPKERGDEDLLKGTFFGQQGTLTVLPINRPESIEVINQGSRLPFQSQTMRITFNSILVTPFNTQDGDLSGTIDIPVVWPQGKRAETFMRKLASEALGTAPTLLTPAETTRSLATPKK